MSYTSYSAPSYARPFGWLRSWNNRSRERLFRPRLRRLWAAVALLLLILATVGTPTAAAADGAGAIEALRRAVAGAALDEAQQQLAVSELDAAAADEAAANEFAKELANLRAQAATYPARIQQLQRALEMDRDQALQEWAARLPRNADAETLERVLAQERSIIESLTKQIDAVAGELALLLSGPAQAAGNIAALQRRLEALGIPAPQIEGEPAVLAQVRQVRRASELRRVQTELDLRLLEQEIATRRQRLHELTIAELRFRQELHVKRTEKLQAEIAAIGRRQLEAVLAKLDEQARATAETGGLPAEVATVNRTLGDELVRQHERLAEDRAALASTEEARDRTAASLRDSQTRLDLGGSNEQVGRWLWSERRNTEPPARLRQRLDQTRGALADARLRLVALSEEQRELLDIPAAARAQVAAAQALAEEAGVATVDSAALEPLLRQRVELLGLLQPQYERRVEALERTEQAAQALMENSSNLQQLLDRHLLWIASHRPVDASWLSRVQDGLAELFNVGRVTTTWSLVQIHMQENPLRWIGSLAVALALLELRRRARARIEAQAAVTRQIRRDTYTATARALAWTLAAASAWPTITYLLGHLLQLAGEPGRFTDSLGQALVMIVPAFLGLQLLRWVSIERGLGHAHFRWLRARREALRRWLPLLAAIVLPLYFVAALAYVRNLDLPNDVQGRIAIVLACGTVAWAAWQLLAVGRLWVVRGVEVEPSITRKVTRIALPLLMLFIAALAISGYVYSAVLMLRTMLATFTAVVVTTIAAGLLGRWFLLGERRLILHRLEERRAAQEAAGENAEALPEPDSDVTLEQVNAQTGRLLRALRLTLGVGAVVWVWADLMPAVARLDEIVLWSFSDTGPDGAPIQYPVNLMALLIGVAALALTVVGARNLPALIEIGLLSRTHIDAPSRYAITSILRYAIVIAGTVFGLGQLGLRWSQLQWMAAALTVGLGFGLQEIFANFVSGLILLFERPFRVGDIITIGELSGRVTRIRTRATTIVDFENKEIVVPNKSFITGQLINWTLSDTTTRVTIKVGVDYGTDPQKVLAILMQAAREHPLVLADPEPQSWFLTFGANSLDFELRVFVANIGDRLVAQNALNIRIAQLFAENGIDMAFPQLDLHIRDLPKGYAPGAPPAPAAGGT